MIEREAGVEADRAKIARVIYNRLVLPDAARHRRDRLCTARPRPALDPTPAVLRTASDPGPVQHVSEYRSAADADRQSRPGVDPGCAPPGAQPVGRRPDLRRSARSEPVLLPVLRARERGRQPRVRRHAASSTTPTSKRRAKPGFCERIRQGRSGRSRGPDRFAGRPQPVAGHPSGRVRRGRDRLVVRRPRGGRGSWRRGGRGDAVAGHRRDVGHHAAQDRRRRRGRPARAGGAVVAVGQHGELGRRGVGRVEHRRRRVRRLVGRGRHRRRLRHGSP